jgi:hypothetical protein
MADHCHYCESQHHQRHVAVPTVPGPVFVVRQAELVLGGLEAVLDGPAMSLDSNERLNCCSGGHQVVK